MSVVIRHEIAKRDLEECFVFIAEGDLEFATKFLVAAEEAFEFLAKNPLIGSPQEFISDKLQGLRMWRIKDFEDYLIFYLPNEEQIEIFRVLHAKRDIESIFKD